MLLIDGVAYGLYDAWRIPLLRYLCVQHSCSGSMVEATDALRSFLGAGEPHADSLADAELQRLRAIQAAALRVASSVRNGVCLDRGALLLLDQALEDRGPTS